MRPTHVSIRFSADPVDGNRLSGIAHTFGEKAELGGSPYRHTFARTAFDRVLRDPATDVRALWQHDDRWLTGRQSSGTLTLEATDEGLAFTNDLPETSYAADLKALVARGDLSEMSFAIVPGKFTLSQDADGVTVQHHTDVAEFVDVSYVAIPAFAGTSVMRGSKALDDESPRSQAVRARHRASKES